MFPHIQIQGILLGRFFFWLSGEGLVSAGEKTGQGGIWEDQCAADVAVKAFFGVEPVGITACSCNRLLVKKKLVGVVGCKHVIMYVYLYIYICYNRARSFIAELALVRPQLNELKQGYANDYCKTKGETIYVFACLFVCLSLCLSVCLLVYHGLSGCFSIYLSVDLFVCLFAYLFVCLSFVCLSGRPSVCLSVCPSILAYLIYA